MSRIGLKDIHIAPLTSDPVGGTPTYGAIRQIVGAAMANINPNSSSATDFLDDGPSDVAVTMGSSEFSMEIGEVTAEDKAFMLGHIYSGGVLVRRGDAVPPWLAVGFKSLKSNGEYRHVWLYKVKFREPEVNTETKGESVTFQHDSLIGTFVKRVSDGNWQSEADSDDANVVPATITNWFTAVTGTVVDTTPPTFTSVPVDGATAVAVGASVVLTFNEPMDEATLKVSNFMFIEEISGDVIPFTLTKGSTSATLTPVSALTALTDYTVIASTNITDISGNALATPGVIQFTTA